MDVTVYHFQCFQLCHTLGHKRKHLFFGMELASEALTWNASAYSIKTHSVSDFDNSPWLTTGPWPHKAPCFPLMTTWVLLSWSTAWFNLQMLWDRLTHTRTHKHTSICASSLKIILYPWLSRPQLWQRQGQKKNLPGERRAETIGWREIRAGPQRQREQERKREGESERAFM